MLSFLFAPIEPFVLSFLSALAELQIIHSFLACVELLLLLIERTAKQRLNSWA